jgi:hypothetical protein
MLDFVDFDRQRLSAFKKNPTVCNSIDFDMRETIHLLKFMEVDYFNYSFGTVTNEGTMSMIREYYQKRPFGKHKLIVHNADNPSIEFIKNSGHYTLKENISYLQSPAKNIQSIQPQNIQLTPVDHTQIGLYTQRYLEVFSAQNNHPSSVEENLKLMLHIPNFHAYLVQHQKECIGICSFWIYNNTLLYTAGGLQEPYRGMKFHLDTLAARTLLAQQAGTVESISSWATSNSASSHNLQAFGLTNTHNYNVYEFTGTP